MKSKPSLILVFIMLLSAPMSGSAYLEDYSPFIKSKPKPFPLKTLDVIEKGDDVLLMGVVHNGKSTPFLKLFGSEVGGSYFYLLSIFDASGNLVKDSVKVADSPFVHGAYAADLNGDGGDDFIVEIGSVATGLGDYKNFIVFALSSGRDYEVTTVENWDSDSVLRDFVDVKRNGHCQFIHTSLVYIEDEKGKSHSHWVYNLLEVRGTKLVLANYLHPTFPKWVWYTIKPNHKNSPFISRKEAIRSSKSQYSSLFWKPSQETAGN